MYKKYYVVWEGIEPGIYDSWEECEEMIKGYPGARYKSFPDLDSAVKAYRQGSEDMGILRAIGSRMAASVNYAANPDIITSAIAVDGACTRNPGPMEYRGVIVGSGQEIFHIGPLPGGTNNIAEYLAIIHALALLYKRGDTDTVIYSDSRTAMSWIRRGHSFTTVKPGPDNIQVMELLRRADIWRASHPVINPILKWNTEKWGEIPADFGRK